MDTLTGKIAKTGNKVVNVALTAIAVVMILYSALVLYDTIYTNRVAFLSDDLSQYRPTLTQDEPTFEEMLQINPDTKAWIMLRDTNIDYPVVQGKDDLEYSMMNFYKQSSLTGAIYLSVVNNEEFIDSFNIIYGHHMDNGAMFGDIAKYEDMEYFYAHQDGILITKRGAYDLKVFARLSADAYDTRIYIAGDHPASDFPDFLYYVESLAVQWDPKTDIDLYTENIQTYINARDRNIAENGKFVFKKMPESAVKEGMQLVALSTCADATTNGRQLLVCTMKFHEGPLPDYYLDKFKTPRISAWGHGEADHWGLLNAVCVILIWLVLLPLRYTRWKYAPLVRWLRKLRKRKAAGPIASQRQNAVATGIEIIIAFFAVFWFRMTQDIHDPMVIVDYWTFGMIILAGVMVAVDKLVFQREKEADRADAPDQGEADKSNKADKLGKQGWAGKIGKIGKIGKSGKNGKSGKGGKASKAGVGEPVPGAGDSSPESGPPAADPAPPGDPTPADGPTPASPGDPSPADGSAPADGPTPAVKPPVVSPPTDYGPPGAGSTRE